ncbi:DUF2905 domain-containing protein [Marinoscillum sp. MHG1-6]|uniref:DUF2905 domain-containing protein n=1 Tax=Marinoscillum sp. MHG1-6 TaxID=2959627 RepID=UPI002157231C|nr:DUF2905 domain-containing protein [Marinoscillum sp. MHG1-6]
MGKYIIYIGIALIIIGAISLFFEKNGFSGLPGDIVIKRENFTFHFPIVTSILISLILSVIFYLINKLG